MKTPATILLACVIALPMAARGQYSFTNNAVDDTNWTNPANWKLGGLDSAPEFPDVGAAAEIAFDPVTMDKEIFLSTLSVNLGIDRPIFLSGNALDSATLNVQSGKFVGGPIDTGTLNITGGMALEGAAPDFTSALSRETSASKVNNDGIIDFDGPTTITGPLTSTTFGPRR